MSPLPILLIALAVVIGGVLFFRLHAFLVLIVGALVVAALTPRESILRQELRKDDVRLESTDRAVFTITDRKHKLIHDARYEVHRVEPGVTPVKIGTLRVTTQKDSEIALGDDFRPESGQQPRVGDHIVSVEAAKAAGKSASGSIGHRVAEGFGRTALEIGILIAMASILGQCLLDSRGAERIVYSTQRAIGVKRTPLAFLFSGFTLGIPVFAEAVFYLLLPLAKAMWVQTRRNYILYVLTIVAGATMTHSLVPPTPGPLFVASELHVNIGTMIIAGSIVGMIAALAGYAYAVWANRKWDIPLREAAGLAAVEAQSLEQRSAADYPPLWLSLLPIVLPVVLISGDAALAAYKDSLSPAMKQVASVVAVLGDKNLALTFAAGIAILTLVMQLRKRGAEKGAVRKSINASIIEAGEIILVIAGGGALGYTLRQAGMSELVHAVTPDWKLALLPMAFGITAIIRIAQGSATVAMITAVGIVGPVALAGDLGYHAVYLATAIGCGSKIGMWMNDSGFWVITKMSGFRESETLKTASVMIFIEGCVGAAASMLGAALLPMV